MRSISTLLLLLLLSTAAQAQPVLCTGFSGMSGINGNTLQIATTVPRNGSAVASSSDGATFYAVSPVDSRTIYFINSGTFALTDSMTTPATIGDIVATQDANRLYALSSGRTLYRINTATKAIIDSAAVATTSNAFARMVARPASKELWTVRDSMVYVTDYTSGAGVTTSFKIPGAVNVDHIRFTPGGSVAFIKYYAQVPAASYNVVRVNAAARALGVKYTRSTTLAGNDVTADSSRIWINTDTRTVICDATTMQPVDSTALMQPVMMTLYRHPSRNEMWGINHFKDTLTVVNAATKAVLAQIRITSSPFFLAWGTGTTQGTKNLAASSLISVFPNPAGNTLQVQLPEAGLKHLMLQDAQGRMVQHSQTAASWTSLDLTTLRAGTYWLRVTSSGINIGTIAVSKQ